MTSIDLWAWGRKRWPALQTAPPKAPLRLPPIQSSWMPKDRVALATSTNAHGTALVQTDVQYRQDLAEPRYKATITSTSYTKSVWELVTIRTGELKGHQAWVLIPCPEFIFPFFNLPPELRQMVYKELFVRDGFDVLIDQPIQRKRFGYERTDGCRPVFVKSDGKTPNVYQRFHASFRPGHPDNMEVSPFLLTSRQFYQEAGAVLFGCNNFRFPNMLVLCRFLEQIGEWRRYIRSINCETDDLSNHWVPDIPKAIEYLSVASLTHLRLDLDTDRFSKRKSNKLVAAWAPLFVALYEHDKNLARVDKVVTFHNTGVCKKHKGWAIDTCRAECSAELCRNVKQALLNRLEPPPKVKRARKPRAAAKS